jgi:Flp pilus assembly protein TadG
MVEFALVLPLLMLLVTAIVQFGSAYNQYLQLTDAVRAGARVASVSSAAASGTPACTAVQQAAPSLGLVCGTTITVTPSPDWKSGSSVTVSAHTSYPISVLGIGITSVSLSSSTTERIE